MGNTIDTIWEIAKPIADELELRLWDVRFEKEGSSWFLRLIIEKEGGVNIADCEAFSRALDAPLEEADPISQSYYLEVSSPGLGRRLTRDHHFEQKMGEGVIVKLIRPLDGRREIKGTLSGYQNHILTIALEDGSHLELKKGDISFVKLDDDIYL